MSGQANNNNQYVNPAFAALEQELLKSNLPEFRPGDTVKVHAKIVEGNKERIQIFEGLVIKRHNGSKANATFTVRKVSYNIGVERTFMLHSPRIEKIEIVSRGEVRRSRLFYLRPLRGKSARIRTKMHVKDEAPKEAAVETPIAQPRMTESAESAESAAS